MAATQIRGSTQIQSGTITADRFVTGLALASTQLADGANFLKKDGSVAMTAAFNAGGFTVSSVGTPSSGTDAATKAYVDSKVAGFQIHFARLASASNVALTGEQTIDGVTTSASRILLTGQTTTSQNGLWLTASGSWTRPTDWGAAASLPEGQYVIIDNEGTAYKNTKWFCNVAGVITVDTTATTFAQDTSGTTYSNGNGLSLTGSTFAVKTGNGVGFDGSNNVQAVADATRLGVVSSSGLGILDGTSGQIIVAASTNKASWAAMSGDVTLSNTGVATVNHTSGSGFLKYTDLVYSETPSGSVNGTNTTFTLANTPQNGSLDLVLNGEALEAGAGNDYTISGTTITMASAPLAGDKVRAWYTK